MNLELHKRVDSCLGRTRRGRRAPQARELRRRRGCDVGRSGERDVPLSRKKLIKAFKMVSYGAYGMVFFTVQLHVLHAERYNLVPFPIYLAHLASQMSYSYTCLLYTSDAADE